MLVERFMFLAKPGRADEMEKLWTEWKPQRPYRVYRTYTGVRDTVSVEMEFESWDQREKFWADWAASPQAKAASAKFNELVAPGGRTSELLRRVV